MASAGSGPPRELASEVAAIVDSAAPGRVIVLGSPPPGGRDLDLLVRSADRPPVEESLRAAGLDGDSDGFVLFKGGRAYAVELFGAETFLAPGALEPLFARALPLDGYERLARPAPPHALLILARLVMDEGGLRPKRQARLERILAEDPGAWEGGRAEAPAWGAERALALLARAARGEPRPLPARLRTAASRLRGRPRRGVLVALSGIDGAGKSSQARALAEAMADIGVSAEVVWNDLLGNRALAVVAALPKAMLALAGRRRGSMARFDEAPPKGEAGEASYTRRTWSTIVTVANALEQRVIAARALAQGGMVAFDRSPLDLAVRMQVLYRADVAMQRRLVAALAPRPDVAFLLDIPPEVSLARKDDIWSPEQLVEQAGLYRALAPQFGVTALDGQRPFAELAAEIARAAWRARRPV
ncbi:MAG TPA: hypothetical protein VFW29_03955 [Solirubrobacteraceae bacterium]|nr:hypothetical protein [Solirubrobacteraceae bacterium]